MQPQRPALKVGFILARQFTLSAFANFVDVLRLAADEGDRSRPIRCSWRVISAHLAAYLVDRHIGQAAARKSLNIMIIEEAQTPDNPQPGLPLEFTTSDKLVRKALHLIRQNVATPLTVNQLAKRLKISRRKLERHFAEALQLSPAEAGISVRLNVARNLLTGTDRSVTQIAAATGFCDASHFGKVFRTREGAPPDAWRSTRAAQAV